jgi:type I restriction enzyme, R subunit
MFNEMPMLHECQRGNFRRKVRRLLAMYVYPPDLSEDATQPVLKQVELSTESASD